MSGWTVDDIPSQRGKLAVITGATGGLGLETAQALAGAGATVVLTGRNADKGAKALARIRAAHPAADISYEKLDLSTLAGVTEFAETFAARHDRIDLLVNNAGIMALPERQVTPDGFERQLGVNYLAHFALTALLLPLLANAPAPRTVQLASNAARVGKLHFDDLQLTRGYTPWKAYAQTKLAMLVFALELQRRSDRAGWGLLSTAAHPGYARTDLVANGPGQGSVNGWFAGLVGAVLSQAADAGTLPQLYAATATEARPGGYYGPTGFMEMTGAPGAAHLPARALDTAAAARFWSESERLTGRTFPVLAAAA